MEPPYNKREIDNFMKDIHEKLDLILTQTTKHNGRLSKVELWKSWILGIFAGGTIIVGLLLYIWNMKIGSIDNNIEIIDYKLQQHMAYDPNNLSNN